MELSSSSSNSSSNLKSRKRDDAASSAASSAKRNTGRCDADSINDIAKQLKILLTQSSRYANPTNTSNQDKILKDKLMTVIGNIIQEDTDRKTQLRNAAETERMLATGREQKQADIESKQQQTAYFMEKLSEISNGPGIKGHDLRFLVDTLEEIRKNNELDGLIEYLNTNGFNNGVQLEIDNLIQCLLNFIAAAIAKGKLISAYVYNNSYY